MTHEHPERLRPPSLPLYNEGSKALDSVEGFFFLEPALCVAPSAGSILAAPAICARSRLLAEALPFRSLRVSRVAKVRDRSFVPSYAFQKRDKGEQLNSDLLKGRPHTADESSDSLWIEMEGINVTHYTAKTEKFV